MQNIKLLDCTLRDGGYVNNWNFGEASIARILFGLEKAGTDIIEVGFLRDEERNPQRTIFSTIESANQVLNNALNRAVYSAMIEAFNPYPLEKLNVYQGGKIDLLRICIWKRCMKEHMEYCREIKKKGYRITIQPSRVEQYSTEEFIDMLKRSNELNPYAVYVVDTWGTQSSTQVCKYLELADRYLDKGINLGYHGHNNKLQALSCAQSAIGMEFSRELCVDASVMGMGRGAGNLNTEIIMEYLNDKCRKKYELNEVVRIFNECLQQTYRDIPWGYSMFYFLSARAGCNPNFATYFSEKKYGEDEFARFLASLNEKEKIVFSPEFVEQRRKEI